MVKFQQGNLSDMDVIGCFVLASTENGLNEIEFNKLIEECKVQVGEDIVRLREDVLPEMSKEDFEKQGTIYLLSQENNCGLVEAGEIYEKLEEKRSPKPKGAYAKIAKALEVPKYSTTEEPQREKPEVEVLEWIPDAGTISRYDKIKNKRKREVK